MSSTISNHECPHANDLYDPSITNAVAEPCSRDLCRQCSPSSNTCEFSIVFGDNSFLVGGIYTDRVSIGELTTMARFGAITRESLGFSVTSCDGVFGMSFGSVCHIAG